MSQFHPIPPLGQTVRSTSEPMASRQFQPVRMCDCWNWRAILHELLGYIYIRMYIYVLYITYIYIMYMMYITLFKSDDQIVWDYIFRFSVRSRWSGDELEPQVILVAGFNPLKKCSPLGIVIPTDGLLHSMDHRVECPVLLDWMDRSRSENNLGSWHALQHREITTVKQISICQ